MNLAVQRRLQRPTQRPTHRPNQASNRPRAACYCPDSATRRGELYGLRTVLERPYSVPHFRISVALSWPALRIAYPYSVGGGFLCVMGRCAALAVRGPRFARWGMYLLVCAGVWDCRPAARAWEVAHRTREPCVCARASSIYLFTPYILCLSGREREMLRCWYSRPCTELPYAYQCHSERSARF